MAFLGVSTVAFLCSDNIKNTVKAPKMLLRSPAYGWKWCDLSSEKRGVMI